MVISWNSDSYKFKVYYEVYKECYVFKYDGYKRNVGQEV